MDSRISELSVDELRTLIAETVRETIEEVLEDAEAMRSEAYLRSVEEARQDYATGNVRTMEQVFGPE